MPSVAFSTSLEQQYDTLFNTCVVAPNRADDVEAIANHVVAGRPRYEAVGQPLGVPWYFIGAVHQMEASGDFSCHLHNGDPLSARTVHVPAGRPPTGDPPFTWEQSADDALRLRGLDRVQDWSLAGTLYQLEGYNGWGYRLYHQHTLSPYLWGASNQYTSGKYVADGTWSDTAVSRQCGAAVILRRLAERGDIQFPDQPPPAEGDKPLVVPYSETRPADPTLAAQAETLQRWLNTFPGIFVKVDGAPGPSTSAAFKQVTGSYLPGDPRAS